MVSSDTVVGIVGAVILTGAMIAVFYYENSNAGDSGAADLGEGANLYTFTFAEAQNTTSSDTLTTTGNSPASFKFDLPAFVYNVHVIVEWQNDAGGLPGPLQSGQDTLHAYLINETGGAPIADEEASTGSIELTHGHEGDEATTPPEGGMRIAADSEAGARETLQANLTERHGAGEWTVRVEHVNGGGGPTASQDTSESFTVTIHWDYWEPQLQA